MTLLSSRASTSRYMQAKIEKAMRELNAAHECLDDRGCEEAFAEAALHLKYAGDHRAKALQAYHDWNECEKTAKREQESEAAA